MQWMYKLFQKKIYVLFLRGNLSGICDIIWKVDSIDLRQDFDSTTDWFYYYEFYYIILLIVVVLRKKL